MSGRKRITVLLALLCLLCALLLCGCARRSGTAASTAAAVPASAAETSPPQPVPVDPASCAHPGFQHGVCYLCGWECPHPGHDRETRRCTLCGELVPHDFVRGVCACGATPRIEDAGLPGRFYQTCEQEGSIESWSYEVYDAKFDRMLTRRVKIYLPWGYDADEQYNVLVLLHYLHGSDGSWLTDLQLVGEDWVQLRHVFDRMMQDRIIRPTIIVTPDLYLYQDTHWQQSEYDSFARELQEIILPHVADNYATYAADGSAQALIAARRHFAIGGNSWGSYFTYDAGMRLSLPYFSSFFCFSGDTNNGLIVDTLRAPDNQQYPVDLYYCAAGDMDVALTDEQENFYTIVNLVPSLVEGENAFFHITAGGGHDWFTWSTEVFNALQLAFGKD